MSFRGDLRTVRTEPLFRPLYATRLAGQSADGVLQAALASAVLFNPEHATTAADAASGFAVLLLPYSLVGPFAGVLLDRWPRQRVLVLANLARSVLVAAVAVLLLGAGPRSPLFSLAALAAVSVNRFVLAALSAALPHAVPARLLVMGNGVSTTSGFVASLAGGIVGLAVRLPAGGGDLGSAVVALVAAGGYLATAAVATTFPDRSCLGPDRVEADAAGPAARAVVTGMLAGARHVWHRRPAANALLAIGVHRLCYGVSTISLLLLYRNHFHGGTLFPAGLTGLAEILVAGGVGTVCAAGVTPSLAARLGRSALPVLFGAAAVVQVTLGLTFWRPALVLAALLLGFVAQSSKICVDTVVQLAIDEEFRGRVFAGYDTVFNVCFVAAAGLGALVLPADGYAPHVVVATALGYAVAAVGYALLGDAPRSLRPGKPLLPGPAA